MLKALGLIAAATVLMVLMLQGYTRAQSATNLQADIFDLRSQISQLRSEVAQIRSSRGYAATPAPAAPRRARSPELTDAQIVDRLAILAIEAKDRLNALESRVSKLEKRVR